MRVDYSESKPKYELLDRIGKTIGIRFRENHRLLSDGMHEYDEYTIRVNNSRNLEDQLKNNILPWIAYARRMEARENSSALEKLEKAHLEELGALIEEIYSEDIEMIDGM